MKKHGLGWMMILTALVLVCQGILPVTDAQAEGDVIIDKLTAEYIFDSLGDALNYGTVAREWDQAAHAETSACVDVLDRHTNTVFANTDSTYFHAMNYKLEVKVSAPQSLQGMSFALYRFDGEKYVRCAGTEKTVTDNVKSTDLTWEIKEDLKNTRLYVFQTDGDGYVADGQQNGLGLQVNYGASVSASAQNDNYIGKIVIHQPMGEGDSMGFFNTFKNSPSLTFGPETRAYYKEFNQETQQYEYIEIIPGVTEKDVGSVLVNYYYTADKDYSAADGDDGLTMGYTKMDGLSYVDGQFVRNGNQVVGVRYMEKGGYADKLLDNAEKFSKEVANLGGGEIISLTPDTTGGSTVTGPVTDDGYVVSLYDAEVGADGVFQVKQDMGWDGIPVAENEYVIINLICDSKDGKVLMGRNSSDITYFYKEGQGRGEGVMWGTADSNSSQRVIFNFVYADENGILQPFEGTIEPTARHGGTLLAPKASVELIGEVHNGAIIADHVYNGQEIHQRTMAPLGRETWVKMDGGYLTLDKIAAVQFGGMWSEWIEDGPLGGAVFGVYFDEACTQLVDKITTDENGVATSGLLAAGDYWVKEITPPDGYGFPTDMWNNPTNPAVKVTVVAGDEPTKVVGPGYVQWGVGGTIGEGKFVNTQTNTQYGDLRVEKIISDNGKPLQGVTFGIYTRNQGYDPGAQAPYNLVGTMTTNRNGVAVYYDLPISTDWYGRAQPYYVKEISAPDGYKISNNNYVEVYLTADGMVTADGNGNAEGNAFANDIIRGNMALKKVDSQTNANLEGAEFTIYSDRNCTEVVGVMTTKKAGDADSRNVIEGKNGLIPGYYYVKETKAPEGYLLPENPTVYTVHVLPDKMVDVVTGNEIKGAPEATAIGNSQAINITGTKVWYDEGFENSRPQEVKIDLYKDTQYLYSATASAANNWTFEFKNLPRYDEEGKEINYIIKENLGGKAYDYYTYINEVDADGNITATVANSIKKTKITGKKVWEDSVQYDPDRPNDITFLLFQKVDDELVPVKNRDGQQMTATGSSWNGYKFEFIDLPSYDAKGNKAEYVVQEAESDKYVLVDVTTGSITDQGNTYLEFILKNRLTVPLSGTKVWQDSSNADGRRPENVSLVVYQNGQKMNPQPTIVWDKETDTDVWQWSAEGLAKYDANNNLNTYTVKEEPVPAGYIGTVSEDGLHFYNTKPGSIRLYKVSQDWSGNYQALNGAEFKLYWDEACENPVSDEVYVTAQTGPTRNGFIEITNLVPGDYYIREEKAPDGFALPVPNKPIKVTVVSGQVARVNGEHGVVVNLSEFNNITVSVQKVWNGDEDKTDARPESITVQLYQNGSAMLGQTQELNAQNNWQAEFTGLPSRDFFTNTTYTYSVKETAVVPGYLTSVAGSVEDGFTITNTYNLTDISVKKEWVGLSSQDEKPEVEVQLMADGVAVDGMKAALNQNNGWAYTFTDLPIKTADGTEIAYTVEETTVLSDFAVTYSGDQQNGFVVTNTVAGGCITLKKVDGDNNSALSGAVFGIYSDEACENLAAEMTTGNDGVATSGVLKAGTWYVKEIQAPQGYQLDPAAVPVAVTVVKDQTVTVQGDGPNGAFTNVQRAIVYIQKVEAEKNEWGQFDANSAKPLAGAEFTIYSDGNCTQEVAVLVTDENGYAEAALVPGRQYWVKETRAPMGYEIVVTSTKDFWANLGNPMQLTWGNWDQNINGAMVNVKTAGGAITLLKADAADSNVMLSGAVFGVYSDAACQNKVAEMPATDANGQSTLENVAVGTWYVKEIAAPDGYKLNDTVYTVNVQANQTAQVNGGSPVTNEKKNLSVTAQLAARKTMNGSSNVPTGYYSFELYEVVNGQQNKLETVQNVAGNVTFSEITYTQAGAYHYVMKEVRGSDAATTYDDREYTATVTVTENNDGLTAVVTYGENDSADVPTFVNTKASVAVQVKKVWNHDGNGMTNTWPASADVVLMADGEWPSDGKYYVTLNENNGWAYVWEDLPKYRLENGRQVEIAYEVYENNAYKEYVVKLEKDETTQENLFSYTLTNTYIKKDQKLELKVPVKKIVEGADIDDTFTFKMSAQPSDPPAPMPANAGTDENGDLCITAETTGSADGTTVYFDTIEITAEKVMYDGYSAPYYVTYGWQVSEVIPDDKNPAVTYDEGSYYIYASFQIDEDGKLIFAQREIWDDDWENVIGIEPEVSIYHYDADWNMEEIPYNNGNFVLPFTNSVETTSISVNKEWAGGQPVNADLTEYLTVHRLEDGALSEALTDTDGNTLRPEKSADGKTYTFANLPAGYAYAVKEETVPGYETSYAPLNIGEDAGQDVEKEFALDGETITNTLNQTETSFLIKKWISSSLENVPEMDFVFVVEPQDDYTGKLIFDDPAYSAKDAFTVVVKGDRVNEYIVAELKMNVLQSGTYRFKVYEKTTDTDGNLNVPDGWQFDETVGFVNIDVEMNADDRLEASVTYGMNDIEDYPVPFEYVNWYETQTFFAQKLWKNYAGEESIDVKLYYREQAWNDEKGAYDYGPWTEYTGDYDVKLEGIDGSVTGEEALWDILIDNLPGYIGNKDVSFGIAEVSLDDSYIVTCLDAADDLVAEDENGLLITPYGGTIVNAKNQQSLMVQKWWADNLGSKHDQRPDVELTLYYRLKGSNNAWTVWLEDVTPSAVEKHYDEGSAWWSFTYEDLPILHNGQEIEFAVQETVPDGYVAKYMDDAVTESENPYAVNNGMIINTRISGTKAAFELLKNVDVTGNALPDGTEDFLFEINGGLADDAVASTEQVSVKDGESRTVELVFDEAGDYVYEISEVVPDEKTPGMTYSTKKYKVEYAVEQDGSQLKVEKESWYVTDENGAYQALTAKPDYLQFINTYERYSLVLEKSDKLDEDKKLAGAVYGLFDNEDCSGEPVYTIETGADGTGTLDNVEKGAYWVKEMEAPDGYDLDPRTYPVTIPADENNASAPIEVPVQDYPLGKVKVQKEWAGDTESDRPESILVQLLKDGEAEGEAVTLNAANAWQAEVDGLQMYDPETDEEIIYTWEETVPDGYRLTGNSTEEDESGVEVTTLTNTLYTASGSIQFAGVKTLTGRALAADEFSFELSGGNLEKAEVVKNAADGTFRFSEIAYTQEDAGKKYTYTVKEQTDAIDTIIYDETVYEITVEVQDNQDGMLTAEVVSWKKNGQLMENQQLTISFDNNYVYAYTAISGVKTMDGRAFREGDSFTLELWEENGTEPIDAMTIMPTEGGSEGFGFGMMVFDKQDIGNTYTYLVKENIPAGAVDGKLNGVIYDQTVYTVKLAVTFENDELKVTRTYWKGADEVERLLFSNGYEADGEIQFGGTKTLMGDRALKDGEFSFQLSDENGVVETVKNAADGSFAFSAIQYTLDDVGEYIYTVNEVKGTDSEIAYDETSYTIKVTVEDNGDGTLNVTADKDETACNFVNEYRKYEADGEIVFSGMKTLNGDRALEAEEFSFVLKDADGNEIETVKNAADGSFAFTAIQYTLSDVGEHAYTVEELSGSDREITYDDTVYEITVMVEDNGDGTLNVTADKDETACNFVNAYEKYEADGEMTLDVEKVMNGRAFQSGDSFTFTVSAVSGVPMPQRTMVTITPAEGTEAKVDFGKIEYTENDIDKTYTYTVKEVAGNQEGITYDDKFHTVTVKITDNGDGTLKVEAAYADGERAILTNIYNAEGELTLDVEKTMKGRSFREGDVFTFTVEAAEGVPMPEMAEVVIEPISGTNAKVDFGKIIYGLEDAGKTYEYTVKETAGFISGVTYDQNAYTVTVQVADNGQGGLTVTPVYENGSRVTIVNTYAAEGTYQLTAQKNLTGRELTDKQFTFVLRNEQGKEIETAVNDAEGRIAFKEIRFSQNDIGKTYTYYVSERNGAQDGYIYDTTVYTVTLTVLDNGDGTLTVEDSGIPDGGMVFENIYDNKTGVSFVKKWQGKEGPAITLTLYQNGVKMDPQPEYVKNGNVYSYENLPRFDENDKEIVYSAKEAFMDGYLTIYENKTPYQNVTDQVMNGGTIINRSVTDFSVRKEWQGLGKNEEAPAITLTLYCNGEPMNVPTPTPDADGWYTYKNLPGTVNGVDAVYTVVETEVEGFTTSYSGGGDFACNGDTIVNRKIPKTGDESMIGLWTAVTAASACAFLMLVKKRRNMG